MSRILATTERGQDPGRAPLNESNFWPPQAPCERTRVAPRGGGGGGNSPSGARCRSSPTMSPRWTFDMQEEVNRREEQRWPSGFSGRGHS